jgi:hypothetical protein
MTGRNKLRYLKKFTLLPCENAATKPLKLDLQHDSVNMKQQSNICSKILRLFTVDADVCSEAQLRALVGPGFKSALDDSIINLLDTTVREIIIQGSEELGIPPLDPAKIDHLDLDLDLEGTW